MPITEELKNSLGRPMGRIPSGVYILTAAHNGARQAMLASWVQQASFDPPAVSIALAKQRPISALIHASSYLALSIVPAGDTSLMRRYARGIPEGQDPFEGIATVATPMGIPALADSLACLECRVLRTLDFGADHELLIAGVTAAQMLREGAPFTHVRGSGFHY
jgi:flavin reductase (DIM6/NTAB) family NADH-FMN oxidoreductase RutF